MTKHVLTNTYSILRGFSTDSKFVRPANVSDKVVNMVRLPDGTFSPRRGYQVQTGGIGGLGIGVYENESSGLIEPVCINKNGNLYIQREGSLTISFNDPNNNVGSYVSYEIYIDPDLVSDENSCDFDPYQVVDDTALIDDCMKFRLKKVTESTNVAVGSGSTTYSSTFSGAPLTPGSVLMTDGTYTIQDDADGGFYGDTGVGTNTIDYTTGAYTVTFSATTGSVVASYRTTLQTQFNQCLGKGFGVASPYSIASLVSQLTSVTGVTVSTTGNTSYPAAFIEIAEETNIADGKSATLYWYYWEEANRTVAATFSGLAAQINSENFKNATFAPYEEAVYIANPYDEVQKYDGQTVYRAGMPQGEEPATALAGAGTVDAGDHDWYITYEQVDNNNRIVEGRLSTSTPLTVPGGGNDVNVTITHLEQGSGWNTNAAIVAGDQTGVSTIAVDDGSGGVPSLQAGDSIYFLENPAAVVNGAQAGVNSITVDSGHTIFEGNVAYFADSTTGERHIKTITATAATTITFGGATVDVADNAEIAVYRTRKVDSRTANTITLAASTNPLESLTVSVKDNSAISANLKINIYRTAAGGTEARLLETIPNNSYLASPFTQVYLDEITDATRDLQRAYDTPARQPDPPPKVGVVKAFGNQLIFTEDPENDDYVWFSEAAQPEYVSQDFNNFIVPSNADDVTGVGVSGSTLLIFKSKSIYSVNGDLITSQFQVQSVAPGSNIGCVSHHTIAEVGGLIYFLHTNGVYAIAETQLYPTDKFGNPIPLSIMIDEIFREDNFIQDRRYVFKRATAVHYTKDHQYLLFLPAEEDSGPRAANNNSRVLMYDTLGKNWFEWTRVNAAGGWYVLDDNLYWQERIRQTSSITAKKYKQHRKYRLIDQVDHVTPIRVTWESSWEDLGQPRVRKKFTRTCLLFDEISALFQENIPTLCFYSYKDWVEGRVSTRADIMQKINSKAWSTDHWSWLSWSGYQDSFITVPLKGGTVAKSIKIGLQLNEINTSFRLQGFQQETAPDFRRTIVR